MVVDIKFANVVSINYAIVVATIMEKVHMILLLIFLLIVIVMLINIVLVITLKNEKNKYFHVLIKHFAFMIKGENYSFYQTYLDQITIF